MKAYLTLLGAIVIACFMACSKGPMPDPDTTGGQDSTCTCNGGGSSGGTGGGTNNGGLSDSSGITVIEKIGSHALFYFANNKGELYSCATETTDGRYLKLRYSDTGTLRTKLVNVSPNAMTVKLGYAYISASDYSVTFPNIHAYTTLTGVPDTTGKLQLWVFRADGKDLIPKKGTTPAINKIIQVHGTLPANVLGEGEIWLNDFTRPQSHITWAFLDSTFRHASWSLYKYDT